MAYRKIGTVWNEKMRADIDTMFAELYKEYTGAGSDAADAREKAVQAVADALLAKNIAEATRDELTAIIREQTRNGDLAPEIAQARGGKGTLGERLNSVDQQLAQIPEQIEIAVEPKADKVYVDYTKRDNSVPIGLNDSASDLLAAIQNKEGETTFNLLSVPRAKTVDAATTTFMEVSTNLYNRNDPKRLRYKSIDNNGNLIDHDSLNVFHYQRIDPNTQYTANEMYNIVAFFDDSFNYIGRISTTDALTYTTPDSAVYHRLCIQNAHLSTFQLNKGNTLLPYEEFYEILPKVNLGLNKNPIKTSELANEVVTMDKETRALRTNTIIFGALPIQFDLTKREIRIPDCSLLLGTRRVRIAKRVVQITSESMHQAMFYNPKTDNIALIPSTELRESSNVLSENHLIIAMIDFNNFDVYALGNYKVLTNNREQDKANEKMYVFSPQEIVGDYEPITVDHPFNPETMMSADVFMEWDNFRNGSPGYITKLTFGNDSSGTLPIHYYHFKPEEPNVVNDSPFKPLPKYIIIGGIHGDGEDAGDKKSMVIALWKFFNDVVNHWQENETLEYLRWNMEFVIVPIMNPWGFDNRSRRNVNQVDLNRNWDYKFVKGQVGANTYGGPEPFSEKESIYIRDLVLDNKDAVAFVDLHATGGRPEQDKMIYFSMNPTSEMYYPARMLIGRLSRFWNKRNYAGLNKLNYHGYIIDGEGNGQMNHWVNQVAGVSATILEGFYDFVNSELSAYGEEIMTMNTEEIGNWIWYSLKYFKEK